MSFFGSWTSGKVWQFFSRQNHSNFNARKIFDVRKGKIDRKQKKKNLKISQEQVPWTIKINVFLIVVIYKLSSPESCDFHPKENELLVIKT